MGVKATLDAVDWPALVATRDDIVARNHRGVEAQLAHAGVEVVRGSAALTGPRSARIDGFGEVVARRGVVLATGSRPRMLPGPAVDGRRVVTSDDALFAPGLPGSVLVVGGGAIGVEYASFHRSMGAEVTLVEAADRLVPLEDAEVSRHLLRGCGSGASGWRRGRGCWSGRWWRRECGPSCGPPGARASRWRPSGCWSRWAGSR